MNVPEDLLYTESHEWIKREGDQVRVGITDHAQAELTDVVYEPVRANADGERRRRLDSAVLFVAPVRPKKPRDDRRVFSEQSRLSQVLRVFVTFTV